MGEEKDEFGFRRKEGGGRGELDETYWIEVGVRGVEGGCYAKS